MKMTLYFTQCQNKPLAHETRLPIVPQTHFWPGWIGYWSLLWQRVLQDFEDRSKTSNTSVAPDNCSVKSCSRAMLYGNF